MRVGGEGVRDRRPERAHVAERDAAVLFVVRDARGRAREALVAEVAEHRAQRRLVARDHGRRAVARRDAVAEPAARERAVEDGRAPLRLERDPVDVVGHRRERRRADRLREQQRPRVAEVRERDRRLLEAAPAALVPRRVRARVPGLVARARGRADPERASAPDVRRDRADRLRLVRERGRDRRRVRQADRLRHREVVHPHPARPRRLGERGVHRAVLVIDRRGDRLRAVVAAHGLPRRRQRREVRGRAAARERRPVVRVFEERARLVDRAAERGLHRREVVTVRVRLGEAEPLVRHEVDVRARVLAVEVERHDQALLHETVVRPQRLEREEI